MAEIALATCLDKPALQPGDRLLAAALERRGGRVVVAPWNGPFAPFAAADLTVVRSTWDYPSAPAAFAGWLDRLAATGRAVANPPALMRWNLDKSYLLALAARGAPLPPTAPARPSAEAIAAAMDALGLDEAVVKPAIGASAKGLSLVRRADEAGLKRAAAALGGAGLVQARLASIEAVGELSLIFFGGAFSHAVIKRPRAGSILVQEENGGRTAPIEAAPGAIAEAAAILALLPMRPVYVRVDLAPGADARLDGGLCLMEVEAIEPELFLIHAPAAADRFAAALLDELKA